MRACACVSRVRAAHGPRVTWQNLLADCSNSVPLPLSFFYLVCREVRQVHLRIGRPLRGRDEEDFDPVREVRDVIARRGKTRFNVTNMRGTKKDGEKGEGECT